MIGLSKELLRKNALAKVRSLSPEMISDLSEDIRRKVESLEQYKKANVVATYVGRKDEVQTEKIIRDALSSSKRVIVPLTVPKEKKLIFSELHDLSELAPGHYSILEPKKEYVRPVPLEEADIVLVPVVAWDERGYRIGHGAGYFDVALAPVKNPTVGLAFEAQRVEKIPEEAHDVSLKMIVTECRVIRMED